ncbi:MAG: hypothetical protein HOJ48_09255 [Desulfobacula sp.]|nr:hypothetical protein [Desulfobacula sp.]
MTIKYCPNCETLVKTKVVPSGYKQIRINNSIAKRRKIIHRIEDGGCGHTWFTYEVPEDVMMRLAPTMFDDILEV